MNRSPHIALAQEYWKRCLAPGTTAIDATCGNGHDTLFLAKSSLSALFALDIQPNALQKTRKLLAEHLNKEELGRVALCQISHDDLRNVPYLSPPRLIVYNLGYLPGGDKSITTKTESTLASVQSALAILGESGAISITCYPGHKEGEKEEKALFDLTEQLSSEKWEVRHHRWLNRPRFPSLLWIERL